ncbi:MAG TPA: hypothetical protein VGS41_04020 [Chthonomonadales bacterium]|nr:hypothetical protein [Chthonomonadales bacterium]
MNPQIPTTAAISIILVAVVLVVGCEWRALYALDHPAPHLITASECASCHSSPAALRMMKLKEGNTHFLFHGPAVALGPPPKRI